mmetsp:Transcript_95240/g.297797  ORF Transcript_95240/g.297797 Transcript_95240/m.297797 type:complete len:326 (+) Transcript_95240:225-1202(+)
MRQQLSAYGKAPRLVCLGPDGSWKGDEAERGHSHQGGRDQGGHDTDHVPHHLRGEAASNERGDGQEEELRPRRQRLTEAGGRPDAQTSTSIREVAGHVGCAHGQAAALAGDGVLQALREGQERQSDERVAAVVVDHGSRQDGNGGTQQARRVAAGEERLAVGLAVTLHASTHQVSNHEGEEAGAIGASQAASVARIAGVVGHRSAHLDDGHCVHNPGEQGEPGRHPQHGVVVPTLLQRPGLHGILRRRRLPLRHQEADQVRQQGELVGVVLNNALEPTRAGVLLIERHIDLREIGHAAWSEAADPHHREQKQGQRPSCTPARRHA